MFINQEEREQLQAKLAKQAEGPPSASTDVKDGTEIYSREGLIQLVKDRTEEFLELCDNEIDLATFAVELLEYCNGPRPEIEILPQGDKDTWAIFSVTLEGDQT